jgi:ADP-ribose pyrophosphatase
MKISAIDVLEDRVFGEGGFLELHRTRLQNRRQDGTVSAPYVCDYANRPRFNDAVVLVLYHRDGNRIEVLLRDGLRPPLSLGRKDETRLFCTEAVAGLIEKEDIGEEGIKKRAALEAFEEAGYKIDPTVVFRLGAKTYPTPGALPEAFHLMAAEVTDPSARTEPPGDGSPMEEGATCKWLELDAAISACVRGDISDLKTEVALRRLKEQLG